VTLKILSIGYNLWAMKQSMRLLLGFFFFFFTACSSIAPQLDHLVDSSPTPPAILSKEPEHPTGTPSINLTGAVQTPMAVTQTPTERVLFPDRTPIPARSGGAWEELPIIPVVSPRIKEIYDKGLELGNNPNAFSKVGDCGSTPAWFLGDFDRGSKYYSLGEFAYLEPVIQAFQGSYGRTSLAAKSGFNASSVFTPLWADRSQCNSNESPLACEYRLQRPSFAFITLGTNDIWHMDTFESQMRRIIEYSLTQGVVPILATKADDREGDGSINATIARLASEYDIPLWNFWLAVQSLPDHGLQEDGSHITWGANRFDDRLAMQRGWPLRNLTALQALDVVWRSATASTQP
jgi:hypothetical protein